MCKKEKYEAELQEFTTFVERYNHNKVYPHTIECSFEALSDWSLFHTMSEVKSWFLSKKEKSSMIVEDIAIKEMRDWLVDDKTGNISDMVNRGYGIPRIQKEIDKCIVLCLNCHAKLHNKEKLENNEKKRIEASKKALELVESKI